MKYEPIIGLEIHAELKTKTKMFCDCLNNSDEKQPNKNICPICLGHPGTLPVINKKAVEAVIKVGLALESEIPEFSKFDRKNYFYPDLPKGYQISQYDEPLCRGGKLSLYLSENDELAKKEIEIERIHLEEDTGKLIHPEDKKSTLIDFNRAGVPLMELVTEPVIHTGKEARLLAQGLQVLLKTLGVSEADMEKGQMRCEVNISLIQKSKVKSQKLGTKVEVKNLNSFRAVERAIEYETKRQKEILERGEKVIQETRGWDQIKEITYSQRSKEEAQDYRYFPEPDLPPLHLYSKTKEGGLFDLEQLKASLPELPWQKKERIITKLRVSTGKLRLSGRNVNMSVQRASSRDANLLIQDEKLMNFFEKTVKEFDSIKLKNKEKTISLAYNYLVSDIKGLMQSKSIKWEKLKITPQNFSQLIVFLSEEKISSRVGKDILIEMIEKGGEPEKIIKTKGLEKISDESILISTINEVIKNNSKAIKNYKEGKTNALQFLVGQTMAKLKGAADPKELGKLIRGKITG